MIRRVSIALACLLSSLIGAGHLAAETFSFEKHEHGVRVLLDGKLFTDYVIDSGTKPYLWPIIGPTGVEMTRAYPMKTVPGEATDHFHQRSMWFTYGEVNDLDFWAEPGSYKEGKIPAGKYFGKIVHREFSEMQGGSDEARFVTHNDWVALEGGKKQLEDIRTLSFKVENGARLIDFDIKLLATAGDVEFGDTKEGAFGLRVPTVMDVKGGHGRIVNSEGLTNDAAWGKKARWVDYHGPIDGETVGIAIFNHPSSFRAPTSWHVRTYGLFAANPFGVHGFDAKLPPSPFTLSSGQSLELRYRVVFHKGDDKAAKLAEAFDAWAATK
jgi:hypothetical protein